MTYRKLAEFITTRFSSEQLDQDVIVYDVELDEYYPMADIAYTDAKASDVLDDNHQVLCINA